jgi:hypothetical protein
LDSLSLTDITATVTSYNFTDGSGLELDNTNNASGSLEVEISTDASGTPVEWFVGAYTSPATTQMQTNWDTPFSFSPGADFSKTSPNFSGDYGFISNDKGTWRMSTTAVPEPSSLLLTAVCLLGLVPRSLWRVRSRRTS